MKELADNKCIMMSLGPGNKNGSLGGKKLINPLA